MKTILSLILSFFLINTYAQEMDSIEKKFFAMNVISTHISYPVENLFLLEIITQNKHIQFLEKLSTDFFITTNDFKQLQLLLNNNEINAGSIVEKRIKEFFINQENSIERLQVIFEKKHYYWIPVEINIKKHGKLEPLLSVNHLLFNILLESTADSYHFQEFTKYWSQYSGQNFKIIPTNFQNATIEHIVFFKNENNSKKIEKVISIHLGYFRPFKTPKNGWLITAITEEKNNNGNYNLNNTRAYIPPLYSCNLSSCLSTVKTTVKENNIMNNKSYKITTMFCISNLGIPLDDYFSLLHLHITQSNPPIKLNNCSNQIIRVIIPY
jgi:hypothetical protein